MCGLVERQTDGAAGLRTRRLLLRGWRAGDLAPFAALNADPEVMRHFPAALTRAQSDALAGRLQERLARDGFGFWAVEVVVPDGPASGFIGFVGLNRPTFTAAFTPCIEIGWRLARPAWGAGYASEAARAALSFAFRELALAEVVSFTATGNLRSRAVMERLGMTRDPAEDFDHPDLPPGQPLSRHVLYRLRAPV